MCFQRHCWILDEKTLSFCSGKVVGNRRLASLQCLIQNTAVTPINCVITLSGLIKQIFWIELSVRAVSRKLSLTDWYYSLIYDYFHTSYFTSRYKQMSHSLELPFYSLGRSLSFITLPQHLRISNVLAHSGQCVMD